MVQAGTLQRGFRFNNKDQAVSSALFFFYCLYLLNFFLHLTQRIPPLGVTRLTALTFAITWLLILVNKPILDLRKASPIIKALNALLIYLMLTLLLTEYPGSVIRENIFTFLKAISFFYFTAFCVDTKSRLYKTIFIFVGCQLFRAYEPLYLNITQGYWGSQTYIGGEFASRLSGSPYDFINANELGFVIVTAIPFLYFLYMENAPFLKKLLSISMMGASLYALILTQSRGAMIALIVVFIFVYKGSDKKGLILCLGMAGVITAFSVMSDMQRERYLSIFGLSSIEASNSSSQGRVDGMVAEFTLGLTTRPIFGNGIGTTAETKFHNWGVAKASHNFYAELLIEIGIIGFFFFIKFIKATHQELTRLREKLQNPAQKQVVNTLYVVFFMYAVYSINYYGLSQYYWYLLAGFVVACSRIFEQEENKQEENKDEK